VCVCVRVYTNVHNICVCADGGVCGPRAPVYGVYMPKNVSVLLMCACVCSELVVVD
jgi:hypothetical protein